MLLAHVRRRCTDNASGQGGEFGERVTRNPAYAGRLTLQEPRSGRDSSAICHTEYVRRGTFLLVVVMAATMLWVAPQSHAATVYENCSQLRIDYPTGVASSRKVAKRAVRAGFERPAVSKRVFKKNRKLATPQRGRKLLCPVRSTPPTEVTPPPLVTAPQPVANLSAVADQPQRGDQRATFSISWQVPAAADVDGFNIRLQDGSEKFVAFSSGVFTTPSIKTFTVPAFGLFDAQVTVAVTARNSAGTSLPRITRLTLPSEPKVTYQVELRSTFKDCSQVFCSSFFSVANGPNEQSTAYGSQAKTYEAQPGAYLYIYNDTRGSNSSTCTIVVDGVIVETSTGGWGAQCDYLIPRN